MEMKATKCTPDAIKLTMILKKSQTLKHNTILIHTYTDLDSILITNSIRKFTHFSSIFLKSFSHSTRTIQFPIAHCFNLHAIYGI